MGTIGFISRKCDTHMKMRCFEEDGNRVFYIRFYEPELEIDFKETVKNLQKRDVSLNLSEQEGTYRLSAPGPLVLRSYSAWDFLMHKYWSMAHEIRQDEKTGKIYCPILLSDGYIEPCERCFIIWQKQLWARSFETLKKSQQLMALPIGGAVFFINLTFFSKKGIIYKVLMRFI